MSPALPIALVAGAAFAYWVRRTLRLAQGTGALRETITHIGPHRVHALVSPGAPESPADAAHRIPLVLVHGWGASRSYFVPLAHRLAPLHPVYLPDLPGHGHSSKPRPALDVPALADTLVRWMDAAGIREAVLVGNSVGCQTVVEAAVRHPDRVRALVLIGPALDPSASTPGAQAKRLLRGVPFEGPSLGVILAVDYVRMGWRRLRQELEAMMAYHFEERLRHVAVPTLVIRGEHDAVAPSEWAERVAAHLPAGSRVVTIAPGAHAVHYRAPDAVASEILDFLRSLSLHGAQDHADLDEPVLELPEPEPAPVAAPAARTATAPPAPDAPARTAAMPVPRAMTPNPGPIAPREARLRPEYATLYPEIEPGVWMSAALLSARRLARMQLDGQAGALARVLDPEHFEFRGGHPRVVPWRPARPGEG